MHSPLVVLGGGPGGYAAAFLAADLGMQVTIVEQDANLGGVCLQRGCIPSKALLHVAKVISEVHEMNEWGVSYPAPIIDVAALRARKQKVIDTLSNGLKGLAKRRNVTIVQAKGVFVDSQTLELHPTGGTAPANKLTFDHCVLAAGSSPTKVPSLSLPTDRVMDSTGALELKDIPESLLVVGGGYIGLEMGSVYAELGSRVSVAELTEGLLPGCDKELVKPLAQRLAKRFKLIELSTKVESLVDLGKEIEVKLTGPQGTRSERFSRVLVSIGRRPNSAGLGLEKTKVTVNAKGFVEVNAQQLTSDPKIYAIGDIAGEPMLAHKAAHEGKVAVEAIHGGPAQFEPLAIPAVVFTDPEVAWAGLMEDQAAKAGRAVEVARYPWAASGRAQSLGRTEGLTKMILDPETERVLGVGLVGPGAGELIAEGVLAIEMGCSARDLAESIHPHPTLSETVGFSAEAFLGLATEIYKPLKRNES